MKIEIKSTALETHNGTSQKTGKAFSIRKQTGYAHVEGEEYPVKISLTLFDDQVPHAPGFYRLSDASYTVGRFGDLQIGRLYLVPLVQEQKKAG